ncbi:unnamed protein product [Closterium sp. NIES-65]|nr:unnamed protein product [Closterium sp. NIES-65]
MMDLKGASANRVVLILVIMTLHSFGEGSGVGVSFAGPRGLSQGLLVTIAIAVHNVPEGLAMTLVMVARGVRPRNAMLWSVFTSLPQPLVAVPAFLGANTFTQFLPLCMGFAAGCMIWIVFGEVLPECIKEGANSSHIASAATLSVAFMEALGAFLEGADAPESWHRLVPIAWALLFFLGPLVGGRGAARFGAVAAGAAAGNWADGGVASAVSVLCGLCAALLLCQYGRGLGGGCVGNAQQKLQGGFGDVQYSHGLQQWVGDGDEKEVLRASGGLLVLKRLACCVARAAAEAEARRQRGLLNAHEVVRREQDKASRAAAMAGGGASGGGGIGRPGVGGAGAGRGMPMGGGRPSPAVPGGSASSLSSAGGVSYPPAARAAAVSNWKGGSCSAVPGDASVEAYGGGMGGFTGGVGGGTGSYGASVGGGKVAGGPGKSSGGGWGGGKSVGGW